MHDTYGVVHVVTRGGGPGVTVLHVAGELDLTTTPLLDRALTEAIRGGGDIHLDLSELRFCDATGLGCLVAAHTQLRRYQRVLQIRTCPASMRRLLTITSLTHLLAPME